MSDRKSLYVLGLSVSQLKNGAYALILGETNGDRRIPLIIGNAEANSIAMVMHGIYPPRPITHDLFVSFAHAYGINVTGVYIYKFEDGIFYSHISLSNGKDKDVILDARTSDAIAIALRTKAPIETNEKVLRQTGFYLIEDFVKLARPDNDDDADKCDDPFSDTPKQTPANAAQDIESRTVEELEQILADLIQREEYEEAERISKLIERKRGEQQSQSTSE